MWFGAGSSDDFDFLAVLYQKNGGDWECTYRFQYFDVEPNRKSWYTLHDTQKQGGESLEKQLDAIFSGRESFGPFGQVKLEKIEVRGDAEKLMDVIAQQPWCHVSFEYPDGKAPGEPQ
jgi:hypothetical protein